MGWRLSSRGRYASARGGLPLSGWRSPKPVSERLPTSGWSGDTQSEPPTPFWGCADARLGGAAVSDYRVYFIGRDGHFLRAIDIQVASDQDAIARALELREGHEVEVWERTRFVRRLSDPTSKL
jgi:hypothetical protein